MRAARRRQLALLALAVVALGSPVVRTAASSVPGEPVVVVSLTFDDGRRDQLQALAPLASHGMRGTFYVVTGLIGDSDFMTWSDLHAIAASGHEIGGHTISHADLTKISLPARRHEVCDGRAALSDRALGPILDFAYPYGAYNADVESVVRGCGYLSARRVGGIGPTGCIGCPLAEEVPPLETVALRTVPVVEASMSLATMEAYVTQAESHSGGGWVIFVFHGICDGCGTYSTTLDQFTAFLDWLQARSAHGTVVRTVGDVLNPAGTGAAVGLPDVSTGPPKALGTTTATVSGSVNANGVATSSHFVFGTSTSYGSATAATALGAGTHGVPVSAALTGLTPATTYHYSVVATTPTGVMTGTDGIFRTRKHKRPRPRS